MHYLIKKYFILSLLSFFAVLNMSAQDLLARQAPSDRRLRVCDSVVLGQLKKKEIARGVTYTENDLYTTWNNTGVHVYGNSPLPDTYQIDLRNFAMPTPSRNVTSRYGYRASFRRNHLGLDVKVYTGDTIVSAWDGKVRVVKYEPSGWGRYVVIRHANGLETLYAHMSKQLVEENQIVKAGEPIGLGGNTGRSTGSHLHLECRLLGEPINPELLFDFPNQDMTGDYYIWHNTNARRSSGRLNLANAENEGEEGFAPAEVPGAKEPSAPAIQPIKQFRYHKVKKGETASSISKKVGVRLDQLLRSNGLTSRSKLHPGQLLKY